MNDFFVVTIPDPIMIANPDGGEQIEIADIYLYPPAPSSAPIQRRLRAMFMRALKEATADTKPTEEQREQAKSEDTTMEAKDVLTMMYFYPKDIEELFKQIQLLMCSPGVCFLGADSESGAKMTTGIYGKLGAQNVDVIASEYVARFFIDMWM